MTEQQTVRLKLSLHGHVQGVGFRPFIFRLANSLHLKGWVKNFPGGVVVEVEGATQNVKQFLLRIEPEKPPHAFIQTLEPVWLDPAGHSTFHILDSQTSGDAGMWVLPDIATCGECLKEMSDPGNRRYRYPFINCVHCGPRYSIVESLPYDRANTSMQKFPMCAACEAEYHDPSHRRHHAQPNACPECGPHLEYREMPDKNRAFRHEAFDAAIAALREGKIVAVKGIGGFHLMTDARNAEAIRMLRERKRRPAKPFAVMFPDLQSVREVCDVSGLEARALLSPEAPIVLLPRRTDMLPENIAPGNPCLGVMLPSNPLHHLVMKELAFPIIATSGNLSEETLCFTNTEALGRLGDIADAFLVHNRGIINPMDDSIVRVVMDREMVLRRGRGLAPTTLPVPNGGEAPPLLAAGPHLKNTVALYKETEMVLSPHIGDLGTVQSNDTFRKTITRLCRLFELDPHRVTHDLHPGYASTQQAESFTTETEPVQHHYAHVLSCMLDNALEPPVLGVSWDGTGLGTDNTIWGGEFLRVDPTGYTRAAHWRTFPLIGGDQAALDPRRVAFGLLYELYGPSMLGKEKWDSHLKLTREEQNVFANMIEKNINVHRCSSAGRLFDTVSALTGLCQHNGYEGEAAMRLEFAAQARPGAKETYTFNIAEVRDRLIIDWQPMIEDLMDDMRGGVNTGIVSQTFHNTLASAVVQVAEVIGLPRVALTGGCFQNRVLTEQTVNQLREAGFEPYWHQRIPPNDGGIAAGQILAALRSLKTEQAGV